MILLTAQVSFFSFGAAITFVLMMIFCGIVYLHDKKNKVLQIIIDILLCGFHLKENRKLQRKILLLIALIFCFLSLSFGVTAGIFRSYEEKGSTSVLDVWPEDPNGLIEQLNSYGSDILEKQIKGELVQDEHMLDKSSPIIADWWVEEHRTKINELGYDIEWDQSNKRYILIKKDPNDILKQ